MWPFLLGRTSQIYVAKLSILDCHKQLQRGEVGRLPSPEEAVKYKAEFTPEERLVAQRYRSLAFVGSPETVRAGLERVAAETGADELMVTCMAYGHQERLRTFELLAEAFALAPAEV